MSVKLYKRRVRRRGGEVRTSMFGLQEDSKTAIAAREPEPIVT